MAVLPPSKPGKQKRPSLKGVLMVDVSQGKERMRAWPAKRGKNLPQKTKDQMEWFRQAQWACKYMDPRIMQVFARATKGTPFLPRDIATMMFAGRWLSFIFPNNTRLSSVQSQVDVSESLDVLGMTPGQTLIRGPEFWEAAPPITSTVKGAIINRPANTASFASNVANVITWTTEVIDEASYWDAATPNRLTVAETGWYQIYFGMLRNQTTNFGGDIILRKNGVEVLRNRWTNTNLYADASPVLSTIDKANAADYYECWIVCYGAAVTLRNATARILGPF